MRLVGSLTQQQKKLNSNNPDIKIKYFSEKIKNGRLQHQCKQALSPNLAGKVSDMYTLVDSFRI